METDNFFNAGYGWICRRCNPDDETRAHLTTGRARFFEEGEAEDKEVVFSTPALARWRDSSRQVLVCPQCGIEEMVSKV
jgi:hypothetical protein